ncbi:jhy protein homolog [Centroberyx gerrardi]|uniref:jhy protein homolog n=1 Tax=Centroberyx gerrardi TaxID=166262 RepID=UPI003AABCE68
MDKGHGKMYIRLKNEQEKPPSPTRAVGVNLWDSAESDTESLAQERAYQHELQRRIGCQGQTNGIQSQEENADSLQRGDREEEDVNDDEKEDLQVYDSLEVAAHPLFKRNCTPFPIEAQDAHQQMNEREASRQLPCDDAYSDLRYDPNWRRNLKGAGRFNESPQLSVEEDPQLSEEKSQQRHEGQELSIKGGYRYIVARGPAVVETPHMTGDEPAQPYHLHPHDGQAGHAASLTSPPHPRAHHHRASQARSPEPSHPSPSTSSEKDNGSTSQRGLKVKHERGLDCASEISSSSPEPAEHFEEIHARYKQEFQTYFEQELSHTQGRAITKQQKSMSKLKSPKLLSNRKLEKLREDIVERNKLTLGRNTAKCGSYLKAHAPKRETPDTVNEVCEAPEETAMAESLEETSDPELRWLQKTQQLRVTQISKEKKARRKGNPKWRPPAPGVKAERGDGLSSPAAGPNPRKTPSSQPPPPTIHLNINLNTSTDLLPFLQQTGRDAVISLASLHGPRRRSPGSDVRYVNRVPQLSPHDGRLQGAAVPQLALSPRYRQPGPGKSTQGCREELNAELHHWHLENSPGRWQRPTAPKWPLPCEAEDQNQSPNELHANQFPEDSPRPPSTTQSQRSGSYAVLPPIGKPQTGAEPQLSVKTTLPIQRSSSDGYLAHMEKQKQQRERLTYKAYTLKDYKQLKQDVNLRGLGPDYTASEKTKMRRQKLYSNVIREQNKKMSRIPFLPAKDPEGSDKKVPRTKALEYAKTIVRPPVQPQPKPKPSQKHGSEGSAEHAPYLDGLDLSQLATLELLRKRHEEEKQAVACFRKVHAV